MYTDRIEKSLLLRAPQSRVWQAISDAKEFGEWFGVRLEGEFAPGVTIQGRITTPGYDHLTMDVFVERVDPESLFSYRWHPYAVDPDKDYSDEPTTLVEFRLEPEGDETRLTIVESGFDRIPEKRRDEAYRMNSGGWSAQIENVARHVSS